MSRIRPGWVPEFSGNAGLYAFGLEFDVDTAVTATGVNWYQKTGDITDVEAFLYNTSMSVLASGLLVAASVVGGDNAVLFTVPFVLSVGVTYVIAAEASGTHGYDSSAPYPITSPDSAVVATQGRYLSGGGYPTSTWSGQHSVDLLYEAVAGNAERWGVVL